MALLWFSVSPSFTPLLKGKVEQWGAYVKRNFMRAQELWTINNG